MIASEYAGPSGENSSPKINIASELGLAENDVADGVVTVADSVDKGLSSKAFEPLTLYLTTSPADIPESSTKSVLILVSSIEPESLGTNVALSL